MNERVRMCCKKATRGRGYTCMIRYVAVAVASNNNTLRETTNPPSPHEQTNKQTNKPTSCTSYKQQNCATTQKPHVAVGLPFNHQLLRALEQTAAYPTVFTHARCRISGAGHLCARSGSGPMPMPHLNTARVYIHYVGT